MNILQGFSKRLIELMEENELNPEKLSKEIGVAPTIVRRWCIPNKDVYFSNLLRVAEYFNCSLDYLCNRSNIILDFIPKPCPPLMEWLPKVIKESGKTSYKIFKDTKIKSSYFTLWRKGGEPQLSSLGILSDYLHCSLDHLVGRDR